MWIPLLIWILHVMSFTKGLDNTKNLQHSRSSSVNRLCPAGCETCSALNGCLSCKPRLFFHLELDGMRQRGACLSSCPRGHYGTRSPQINTCTNNGTDSNTLKCPDTVGCKDDCALCFSENFCTRCYPGHFLFRGKCEDSCPHGLTPNTALGECTDCPVGCEVCVRSSVCVRCRADLYFLHGQCLLSCPSGFEADVQLMQCNPQVHCEVGEWTDWGPCIWKRTQRAYKRGEEMRSRHILRPPSVGSDPCPHMLEFRRCIIRKSPRLP